MKNNNRSNYQKQLCTYVQHSRVTKFVKDCNILYDQQYGFRSKHIAQHAIVDIVNTILQNMGNGKFSRGVSIDLKKGFDTLNHEILLAKLENYGIRGVINSWFRSYLTDRNQITEVNNVVSEAETPLCGVPLGSILGPLLFLLYINDIYKSSSLFAFYLFADDTRRILANNNLKELETRQRMAKGQQTVFEHKKIKLCNLSSPAKEYALHT